MDENDVVLSPSPDPAAPVETSSPASPDPDPVAPVEPSPSPEPEPEPVAPDPAEPAPVSPSDEDLTGGGEDVDQQPGQSDAELQPGQVEQQPVEILTPGVSGGSNIPAVVWAMTPQQTSTVDELELVNVETFALSPITSSTGLKGILLDILGPYDNIVTQYKYQQNTSSNYTYINEVTPDYPWIASAALFITLMVSLFSLLKRGLSWMR